MMRRTGIGALILAGGLLALLVGPSATGSVPAEAKYLGSKLCKACHQATHAEAIAGWTGSLHARALWKVDEADQTRKIVADFTKNAPFPKELVAYVLGTGRKYQMFLDSDFKVLPGEWVVKDSAWKPHEPADAKKDCLGCHTTGYDPEAGKWVELSVGCEMCHGPGSTHAAAKNKKASIVRIQALDAGRQAMLCGRCHSQGRSKDGAYPFAAGFRPGDDLDLHFTLTQQVPKGASNSQYNELRLGGGKHLASGVSCATCHDPHSAGAIPHDLRGPINQVCLDEKCHGGKLTGPQHTPEALKSSTCNMCHMPAGSHSFVAPRKG